MCRGDESQAWRRSVCGQNKMHPVFKGVFKQPIWGWNCGWVNSTSETPLWLHIKLFHTIKSAHTHTHTPYSFFARLQSHRRRHHPNWNTQTDATTAAAEDTSSAEIILANYSKSTHVFAAPENIPVIPEPQNELNSLQ